MGSIEIADKQALQKEIQKAIKFYEDFHWGRKSDKEYKAKMPIPPDVVSDIGYFRGIVYETIKGDDNSPTMYFHSFRKPFPIVSTSPEGIGLFISGGKFKVIDRGIVD